MTLVGSSFPHQQVNMPALDLRRYLSTLVVSEGVAASTDMQVQQRAAGANMSVDITAGEAMVQGDAIANQGMYWALNDATFNLTGFTAAHATLPRIDRVVLRVRDAFHGDAANDMAFVILTGTATSGATLVNLNGAASVGNGQLLLANILIPATATTITTANIDTTGASNNSPAVRPLLTLANVQAQSGLVRIAEDVKGASAASFDFQNIPSTYRGLRLVGILRGDNATTDIGAFIRFNNDSGANYDVESLRNSGASATVAAFTAQTSGLLGDVNAASSTSGKFGAVTVEIPSYATNGAYIAETTAIDTGVQRLGYMGGHWRGSPAINRIQVITGAGNWVAGSRLTLYGYN